MWKLLRTEPRGDDDENENGMELAINVKYIIEIKSEIHSSTSMPGRVNTAGCCLRCLLCSSFIIRWR
jgi:pyruvate-formate lyase-activating enzyme